MINEDKAGDARELISFTQFLKRLKSAGLKGFPVSKIVKESELNPNDPHGDYEAKRKALQDIQMDPHTSKDPDLSAELQRRKHALEKEYEQHRGKK